MTPHIHVLQKFAKICRVAGKGLQYPVIWQASEALTSNVYESQLLPQPSGHISTGPFWQLRNLITTLMQLYWPALS